MTAKWLKENHLFADAVLAIAAGVAIFLLIHSLAPHTWFHPLSHTHEGWEFNELLLAAPLWLVLVTWYFVRRKREQDELQLEHLRAASRLRDSEQYLREIAMALPRGLVVLDPDGRVELTNPEAEQMLGWSNDELLHRDFHVLVHRHGTAPVDPAECAIHRARRENTVQSVEDDLFTRKDGRALPVAYIAAPMQRDGRAVGFVISFEDISDRKRAQQEILVLNRALTTISECNKALVHAENEAKLLQDICRIIVSPGGYRAAWVAYLEEDKSRLRPVAQVTAHGENIADALCAPGVESGPFAEALRTRQPLVIHCARSDARMAAWRAQLDQQNVGAVAVFPLGDAVGAFGILVIEAEAADAFNHAELQLLEELGGDLAYGISALRTRAEHRRAEGEIAYRAYHDALTGLPNRNLFRDRLRQAIAWASRSDQMIAVLFLDLDRFKQINDSLGHGAGDQALITVATRIQQAVRGIDSVARYGGDEFVILLPDIKATEEVRKVATRIATALAEPLQLEGHETRLAASIGAALYPRDGDSEEVLLQNADAAMYHAKASGRNNLQFFSTELNLRAVRRLTLEGQLHQAIAAGQFELHYQPQLKLGSGKVNGVEALIRWNQTPDKTVSPSDFIPVAEESGLIVPLGTWVLRTACAQAATWQRAGLRLRMAVNVSPRQMEDDGIVDTVAEVLTATGLDPALLELEVTENALMNDPSAIAERLRRLRALGITLSIDDFGTGYSSLSYLKQLPIQKLKIDQSFVRDLTSDPEDAAIARSVIGIAHSLRLEVLAEGVETEAQLRYLERNGCDAIQGFFFCHPLPATALEARLHAPNGLPRYDHWRSGGRPGLLILDDDPIIAQALRPLLHNQGYALFLATTPERAFELLATNDIAVVIADQPMPLMSGAEFLRRVRDLYPATVRIALTGYTEPEMMTRMTNEGSIYTFIAKPWDNDELERTVRSAFTEYKAAQARRLDVAGCA